MIAPRWIDATLRARWYPRMVQRIAAAACLAIVVSMLFGTDNSGQNAGMALVWTLWWPLLPLSFIVAGRAWCAVCPFAWLTRTVERAAGVGRQAPRLLRRCGPWAIAILFVAITYVDETWRLSVDARRTGYLLLGTTAAVVFFAAFFERQTFCRYLCFVGGFAANYSRAGMLHLEPAADRCRTCIEEACHAGGASAPGCPVFLRAAGVEDAGACHLCGNCVKNCDAIRAGVHPPLVQLWRGRGARPSQAVLTATLAGVVLIEQAVLLRSWIPLVAATARLLHVDPYTGYPLVYAVLLAAFVAVPLAGLAVAGALAATVVRGAERHRPVRNAILFSDALIPVVLASHLAHGAGTLLTRSRALPFTFLALAGSIPPSVQAGWLSNAAVYRIELALLAVGGAGSLYAGYRIARRRTPQHPVAAWLPHAALLIALLAANVLVVVTLLREKI